MHDRDWETQNVLQEIESYEKSASTVDRPYVRRVPIINTEFERKLDTVNQKKQMYQKKHGWENGRGEISKNDIAKWKEQVMLANRPMNQYAESRQTNIDIPVLHNRYAQQRSGVPSAYTKNDVQAIDGENTVFSARNSARIPSQTSTNHVESSSEKSGLTQGLYHAKPCYIVSTDKNDEASFSGQHAYKKGQIRQSESISSPNEEIRTKGIDYTRNYSIDQNSEAKQRQKYEEFVKQVEKDIQQNQASIGICGICGGELYERSDVVFALEKIFHNGCLVCELCGRTLKGKKFYKIGKKFYCEEDYLYTAMHSTAEKCASCGEPIITEALQAFGKTYHPQCFRCFSCNKCLDGIPFAVDDQQRIYCTKDYGELFAPKCVQCQKPIYQADDNGRVTRLIVDGKNYHINCFVCEGCRCKLTEVGDSACYPLNGHILCQNCHRIWKRTGGTESIITDL